MIFSVSGAASTAAQSHRSKKVVFMVISNERFCEEVKDEADQTERW